MPGIEEPQKQDKIQHLHPHGDEGGEGTECRQVPNPDCCYHKGKGKYPEIKQHKRLNQDLPADVCHGENHLQAVHLSTETDWSECFFLAKLGLRPST
jgi:hypothetical protein